MLSVLPLIQITKTGMDHKNYWRQFDKKNNAQQQHKGPQAIIRLTAQTL